MILWSNVAPYPTIMTDWDRICFQYLIVRSNMSLYFTVVTNWNKLGSKHFPFGAFAAGFTCVIVGLIEVFSFWMGPLTKIVLPFDFDVDTPSTYPSPRLPIFCFPKTSSKVLDHVFIRSGEAFVVDSSLCTMFNFPSRSFF